MLILVLLFLVLPVVELYVIVQTSQSIGFSNTLGLLILISIIGGWLVKREGMRAWTRFVAQVETRQTPTKEIADGACIMFAGALMLTPGFVTDVLALLLLIPPTRAIFRGLLVRRYQARAATVKATYGPAGGGSARGGPRRGPVIDTTAADGTNRTGPDSQPGQIG